MQDSYLSKFNCGGFVKPTKPPAQTNSDQPKPEAIRDQIERDEFGCPKSKLSQVEAPNRSIEQSPQPKKQGRFKRSPSEDAADKAKQRNGAPHKRYIRSLLNKGNNRPKSGPREFVKEENYGGLPDWKCTCGQSVWPRKKECFKCGARRSQVTGRDSLGYTEAKKVHQEKVQKEYFAKQSQARQEQMNSLTVRSPKGDLITDDSSSHSPSRLHSPSRFEHVHKRPMNCRFAGRNSPPEPTNDRFRRTSRSRERGPRRPANGRFAAGLDKSPAPATKPGGVDYAVVGDGKIVMW